MSWPPMQKVDKLCKCGRIMRYVDPRRVLCDVCREEHRKASQKGGQKKASQEAPPEKAAPPENTEEPGGSDRPLTLAEVSRAAAAAGMSYGKYVAMLQKTGGGGKL